MQVPILRQPDRRSCGAASVEMARLLHEGTTVDQVRFSALVLARHEQLTSMHSARRWQVPWPRALGTPPWAVASALAEISGVEHRVRLVRWAPAARRRGPSAGALYVGSRWLPRHVVLVLPDGVTCYNPSTGKIAPLVFPVGQWTHPWISITADPSLLGSTRHF